MATLPYVGPAQSGPNDLATKAYEDGLTNANLSQPAVDALISTGFAPYALQTYVTQQDALNATKGYIDTGDATRLQLSDIDINNGVAGLDAFGKIDVSRINLASQQIWPTPFYSPSAYNGSTVIAAPGTEAALYTMTVPDQGYPYLLQSLYGTQDVSTDTPGEYPIVRVRLGSATGLVIAEGHGAAISFGIPPSFDAVGGGFTGTTSTTTPPSWSHIAADGAHVIVDIIIYGNGFDTLSISGCTYAGQPMNQTANVPVNNAAANGRMWRYELDGVPGGTATVVVTPGFTAARQITANSVSYTNVDSAAVPVTAHGTGNAAQSVSCGEAQLIVQSFGNRQGSSLWTPGGGTNRYNNGVPGSGSTMFADLCISEAPTTTNFTATGTSMGAWSAIATVLTTIDALANNNTTATIVPTQTNRVLNGSVTLFVTIASSGPNATVSATNVEPSLWVTPVGVAPFVGFTETNTTRTSQPVPQGTSGCYVTLIGAGGAGGNGMVSGANNRAGGSGGGGGGRVDQVFVPAYALGDSYSVVQGTGGAAAQAAGIASTFASGSVALSAGGGAGGITATSTTTAGGAGGVGTATGIIATTHTGTAGGAGVSTLTPSAVGGPGVSDVSANVGAGGGAGGGVNKGNTAFTAGGAGGNSTTTTGGVGGTISSANGAPAPDSTAGNGGAGGGGGVGHYNASGVGNGGHGGLYGGGGGGGGTGSVAGQFGAGGDGFTLVEWV